MSTTTEPAQPQNEDMKPEENNAFHSDASLQKENNSELQLPGWMHGNILLPPSYRINHELPCAEKASTFTDLISPTWAATPLALLYAPHQTPSSSSNLNSPSKHAHDDHLPISGNAPSSVRTQSSSPSPKSGCRIAPSTRATSPSPLAATMQRAETSPIPGAFHQSDPFSPTPLLSPPANALTLRLAAPHDANGGEAPTR
ncbi:hypothetical protein EJ03DRAFT_355658 [Teratosphaeria nubilosa]|uniref:Uncharacterized protein n=1 Tax=Teratosphaeria nubilosa TaxID=161662 RepID=A0A6G1KVC9_9PEZI|nr:hypothetical protein EJ03DRAFT_355658 [Teratosphaeria nubilosa]